MRYDDFSGKPLPLLLERIKIKLREQVIDFFQYGEKFKPKPIYLKSEYLDEHFLNHKKQISFDKRIKRFGWLELSSYGPSFEEFTEKLREEEGLKVCGFKFYNT
jgi:hypothetical protein